MNIEIRDLWFTYPNGVRALRGVNLELAAGARVALLGQNGAGKTTLVKHLNGLLKPERGRVTVGDWDTRAHSIAQMARRVGFVFQNPDDQLFRTSIWEEVAFGPSNLGFKGTELEARVREALVRCNLDGLEQAHPYDLAPWQRRWVALASILAMRTPVLVLDEPTTGQDARGQQRLVDLLDELRRQAVTVIAITHDVDFAVEHFPELVVMAQGQVVARGDARVLATAGPVEQAGLEAPQLARLAQALGWEERTATEDEFLRVLAHH